MNANKMRMHAIEEKPQSRSNLRAICFRMLAALCLSLVLFTGCGQSDADGGSSQTGSSQTGSSQAGTASQGADDYESGSAGFVLEDTAVVDVQIDEE